MKKILEKIEYVVYCNDGCECGSGKTLKEAKEILKANRKADRELGIDDIDYYIEKEYSYKVVGQKAGILESERVY